MFQKVLINLLFQMIQIKTIKSLLLLKFLLCLTFGYECIMLSGHKSHFIKTPDSHRLHRTKLNKKKVILNQIDHINLTIDLHPRLTPNPTPSIVSRYRFSTVFVVSSKIIFMSFSATCIHNTRYVYLRNHTRHNSWTQGTGKKRKNIYHPLRIYRRRNCIRYKNRHKRNSNLAEDAISGSIYKKGDILFPLKLWEWNIIKKPSNSLVFTFQWNLNGFPFNGKTLKTHFPDCRKME